MNDIYIDHFRYTSHVSVRTVGSGQAVAKKKAAGCLRGLTSLKVKTSRGEQLSRALGERDSQLKYGSGNNAKQGCIMRYFANLEKILAGKKRGPPDRSRAL
ncbi:hypothetical protein [Agrobacterium tumefaciens]|uniref:hypothetical protein n=1 Tax=Agrobacterium tumefaciens TaxID=358 RepID=UPI001110F6FB|nr:hypothetical protein [Agrobacterium tumefaciens]MBP2535049.1 hypothetical protein [Agrobacterium tumefaciens]MDP9872527.1 hypothetical protein [Agrobacterium tumefaciens]MDP9975751.1 hypothetical protein [Agrobacterium tumefaciens]